MDIDSLEVLFTIFRIITNEVNDNFFAENFIQLLAAICDDLFEKDNEMESEY